MPKVSITIRSMTAEPRPEQDVVPALMHRHVVVLGAGVTPDGMQIRCEPDVDRLRRCGEYLASLSFVGGVSLQRYQAAASPDASET
jgi:hypothetical protein